MSKRTGILVRLKPRAAVLSLLLLAMVAASGARAGDAQDEELRARKMFAAGNFKAALDAYTDLFAHNPHPTYMRNIGRCYQNLGEPDRAISAFREYLRTAKEPTPQVRTEIEGFITEMQDLKRSRAAAASAAAPGAPPSVSPPPRLEAPPTTTSVTAPPSGQSPLTVQAAPPTEPSGSIFGRWWFWTTAAVVVAAAATAIVIASSSSAAPSKQSDLGSMRAEF